MSYGTRTLLENVTEAIDLCGLFADDCAKVKVYLEDKFGSSGIKVADLAADEAGNDSISVGIALAINWGVFLAFLAIGYIFRNIYRRRAKVTARDKIWRVDFHEVKKSKLIGIGRFGKVYKGVWREKEVAVKVLIEKKEMKASIINDFIAEVSIMCDLRHPNVLLFIGACVDPPNLAIITEFMGHGSLWDILHRPKPDEYLIQWNNRIKLAVDVALGMNYIHGFNPVIIHRDLKSPNVLLNHSFECRISDFGLSTLKSELSGSAVGNPLWNAPEIYHGEKVNEKMDVYSFGIMLWEIVTMEVPFHGYPLAGLPVQVSINNLRPEMPKLVPKKTKDLIAECWHKDPTQRPDFKHILSVIRSCKIDRTSVELGLQEDGEACVYQPAVYETGVAISSTTEGEVDDKTREFREKNGLKKSDELVWDFNPSDDLEMGAKLGEGMSGEVFYAKFRGSEVAVKKIFYQSNDDEAIIDFHKEAELMKKIKHEKLVALKGCCVARPFAYIVTEFMHHGSVYDMYKGSHRTHPPSWSARQQFSVDVAIGMVALHSLNVVHRDLKSPNVMCNNKMEAKIGDFGLSRVSDNTKTMTTCGSPLWASPEMLISSRFKFKLPVLWFVMTFF
jgi:serine/threonine protein kinase